MKIGSRARNFSNQYGQGMELGNFGNKIYLQEIGNQVEISANADNSNDCSGPMDGRI